MSTFEDAEEEVRDGRMLVFPNGYVLPFSDMPVLKRSRWLRWVDNEPVTPWRLVPTESADPFKTIATF